MVNNLPFLVLNFGLDIVDCVRRLDFKSDGFAREARMNRNISNIQVKGKETHVLTKICMFNRTLLSVQRIQRWSL